jgi:hypothetical protein
VQDDVALPIQPAQASFNHEPDIIEKASGGLDDGRHSGYCSPIGSTSYLDCPASLERGSYRLGAISITARMRQLMREQVRVCRFMAIG